MQANPKHTRIVAALSTVALLSAAGGCAAQPQPMQPAPVAADAPPPPPPGIAADATPPPPPVAPADPATASTAQGTVARFLINPDGDVDGFLTNDGLIVRFPPHMGAQLTSLVQKGDAVRVSGWRDGGGSFKAQRISDTRSGQQLEDQPPPPGAPRLPRELRGAGLSRLTAQGQVAYVTTAPRGEPDGVILADGTVIKLTPPVVQQFPSLVQRGAQVSAQGYGTRNQYGAAMQATAFGTPGKLTPLYDRAPPRP